jgi:hypothetical protein
VRDSSAAFARQARIRVRTSARVGLTALGAAGGSFVVWRSGWQFFLSLAIAGFFAFVFLTELLAAIYNERT